MILVYVASIIKSLGWFLSKKKWEGVMLDAVSRRPWFKMVE